MKKRRKEFKRKNPVYLEEVIRGAQVEIGVLSEKIDSGCSNVEKLETRICTLMNQTIPNAEMCLIKRQ